MLYYSWCRVPQGGPWGRHVCCLLTCSPSRKRCVLCHLSSSTPASQREERKESRSHTHNFSCCSPILLYCCAATAAERDGGHGAEDFPCCTAVSVNVCTRTRVPEKSHTLSLCGVLISAILVALLCYIVYEIAQIIPPPPRLIIYSTKNERSQCQHPTAVTHTAERRYFERWPRVLRSTPLLNTTQQ